MAYTPRDNGNCHKFAYAGAPYHTHCPDEVKRPQVVEEGHKSAIEMPRNHLLGVLNWRNLQPEFRARRNLKNRALKIGLVKHGAVRAEN